MSQDRIRTKLCVALALPACLVLAACGSNEPTDTAAVAEDFSARINGPQSAAPPAAQAAPVEEPTAVAAPDVAEPLPQPGPGAYTPGTYSDPAAKTCSAPAIAPFIGRPADDATRAAILEATTGVYELRFIPAGTPYIAPDATNPRLNVILDNLNVIRDAKCG